MRRLGLAATAIGAIASVALLFYVGMRRGSNAAQPVVMILIGIWVLSPFLILYALNRIAPSKALSVTMIMVPVISLTVYLWGAMGPIRSKPAAPFVVIPPVSWILIAISLVIARLAGKRSSRSRAP